LVNATQDLLNPERKERFSSYMLLDCIRGCVCVKISPAFMYKYIYPIKTNNIFKINIPVPSITVHYFLLSNFMTL